MLSGAQRFMCNEESRDSDPLAGSGAVIPYILVQGMGTRRLDKAFLNKTKQEWNHEISVTKNHLNSDLLLKARTERRCDPPSTKNKQRRPRSDLSRKSAH